MKDVQQINWPMLPTLSPGTAAAMVQPLRWLVGAADWALTLPMHRRKRISDSQIWLITEKEIITNIQNLKSPAAFLLMAILILISFFLMSADYQKRMDNWSNNKVAQKDKLFSGITSSYRSTDSMMMYARALPKEPMLRRPLPLSIFAKGLDSVMERSVTIGDNPVVPVATSFTLGTTQERNRNLLLFAPPDYLYIIKIILSLLAMFITYDALVGEKESGTLKAMLSGAVRRRTILVGKWIGASISIIVPFLFASGIGFVYLVGLKHFTFDQSDVYRILLTLASSCLYILVFVGLGLFISAVTGTQKTAIAAALSVWVILVLVIPNMSILIAERSKPLPSIFQHNAQLFAKAREIEDEADRKQHSEDVYPGYGASHESEHPRIRQIVAQADDDFVANRLNRDRFARSLARLSPASSFTYAVTDLAGTGVSEYQSYLSKLKTARDKQIALQNQKQTSISISAEEMQDQAKTAERLNKFFEEMNQLQASLRDTLLIPRSPAQAMSDALPDLSLLIVWAGLLLVAATIAFNRADVR